jgi:hypothetical protein
MLLDKHEVTKLLDGIGAIVGHVGGGGGGGGGPPGQS